MVKDAGVLNQLGYLVCVFSFLVRVYALSHSHGMFHYLVLKCWVCVQVGDSNLAANGVASGGGNAFAWEMEDAVACSCGPQAFTQQFAVFATVKRRHVCDHTGTQLQTTPAEQGIHLLHDHPPCKSRHVFGSNSYQNAPPYPLAYPCNKASLVYGEGNSSSEAWRLASVAMASAALETPSELEGSSCRISASYTLSHRPSVPARFASMNPGQRSRPKPGLCIAGRTGALSVRACGTGSYALKPGIRVAERFNVLGVAGPPLTLGRGLQMEHQAMFSAISDGTTD